MYHFFNCVERLSVLAAGAKTEEDVPPRPAWCHDIPSCVLLSLCVWKSSVDRNRQLFRLPGFAGDWLDTVACEEANQSDA